MVSRGQFRRVYNNIQKINDARDQILDSIDNIREEFNRLAVEVYGTPDDPNENFTEMVDEIENSIIPDAVYNLEDIIGRINQFV